MSRITVLGGTGYAGSAIVAEAASRGHAVTSLSRSLPTEPLPGVDYVTGDVTDEATLASAVDGADVVVGALAPRGPLTERFRPIYRTAARLADVAGIPFFVVGGFSSLRPAPGADRFVTDLSHTPEAVRPEVLAGAGVVMEDLPATPESLNWVFVSPPLGFGSFAPKESVGAYRLGDDVAVDPTGGSISAADYALGVADLIEAGDRRRAHVNLAH